uniref:Paired domain-containing protein n=1 Tax=Syphacia muris TaxID=451379 RepID=A0A0N5AQB8_9BILA
MAPITKSSQNAKFQKKLKGQKNYTNEPCYLYADILNLENKNRKTAESNVGESARNRFGRPYISGRPLLKCDRWKIIEMYVKGIKKIRIAQELRVTHSCVSKVIRRYNETGIFEARSSRTASCACPGSADQHDLRICRHVAYRNSIEQSAKHKPFTVEWILSDKCNSQTWLPWNTVQHCAQPNGMQL